MSDDDFVVTITGPALSMLLFENARCHDQIGFLLGDVLHYVSKKDTDSEREVQKTALYINIISIVAYPISKPFFNTIGQIDKGSLENCLRDNVIRVVGWYHYQREPENGKESLRNRILHSELSSYFSKKNNSLTEDNFLFFRLNSNLKSKDGGTHKFKQLLLRRQRNTGVFQPVSFKINNLGCDSTIPNGTDYKPIPIDKTKSNVGVFSNKIFNNIRKQLEEEPIENAVILVQKHAEIKLEELSRLVTDSDKEVADLELLLLELRLKYQKKKQEIERDNNQLDTEPRSPAFLEVIDSVTSCSSTSTVTRKHTKQEKRIRQSSSSERELPSASQSKEFNTKEYNRITGSLDRNQTSRSTRQNYCSK